MSGKDTKANEASKPTKAPAPSAQSNGVRATATRTVNGGALPTAAPTAAPIAAPTPIVTAPPGLPPPGLGQVTSLPKTRRHPLFDDDIVYEPLPTLAEMLKDLKPLRTIPIGSPRLVMEQLRDDQGVRIPWGWNVNKWVIIEEFKDGFPVWESHIFWGKFVQDEREVVCVRPQRQLIFYSQYRFLQELPTLYLESISKAPEATKKIAAPRILPEDQHVPVNTPHVMTQYNIRMPSSDENLPIDMYPRFEAVLRPGVRKVGQAHVDAILLTAHRIGLIAKPEMVYYKTDESGLDMMPIRLNPVFGEPATQYVRYGEPVSTRDLPLSTTDLTESIDSLELHSIPSSKAASVRNDAGEDVLGESDKEEGPGRPVTATTSSSNQQEAPPLDVTTSETTQDKKEDAPSPATTTIPPSNPQEAPQLDVTTSDTTPDKKEVAPSADVAASSEDILTAIPAESIHDLLTAIEELSDSDDDGEETCEVVDAETMTAMVSETLEETPAPTVDDIVEAIHVVQEVQEKKLKKKKKSPPLPRKLRATRQEERAMEELLAKDSVLQVTVSSFPDVMAHYIEQQEAARKLFFSQNKMAEKMDGAIKDILFYVNENKTTVWSEQEDNARVFITERKNFHRTNKNVRDFFLWREFEALLELPEVLLQDMCFLAKSFQVNQGKYVKDAIMQETQYFAALFRIKELGALLSPSEERVNWDVERWTNIYKENMEMYLNYMSILRTLPAGYNIRPLELTELGIQSWESWHKLKDTFKKRKTDVKKRTQESFLGTFASLHLEHFASGALPDHRYVEAHFRIGVDLLKNAEYHPVLAFDCYFIQTMLKQHGEQYSYYYWHKYFHEVFRTERSVERIKK